MKIEKTIQNGKSISTQLEPFVSSLQIFINKYQEIMIKISESLPEIERRIEDNILEARELLNFLFAPTGQEQTYGVKNEIIKFRTHLDSILEDLGNMNEMDQQTLSDLKQAIEISNNTAKEMESIFNISENLKVYAINSIVNSRKAGESGRGYQMISSEFIKLSEHIASGTKEISEAGAQVQSEIETFLKAVEELEVYSDTHLADISKSSADIFKKANFSIGNFSSILNDLLDRIESSKEPTYQIMVELQKQDIIHQQLTHLVENINDILVILDNNSSLLDRYGELQDESEIAESRSLYTLLIFLIENTEHQISRINSEFSEMVGGLERLFISMHESISDVSNDKNLFSDLVLSEGAGKAELNVHDKKSVINYIFDSPGQMLKDIKGDISSLVSMKKNILILFMDLEKKIELKKNQAEAFLPMIESIKNLLLLSRIEQARYRLHFSIAGTGHDDKFFKQSFSNLAEIIENISITHADVIGKFQHTQETFGMQESHYSKIEENFLDSARTLQQTKDVFLEHFETVMDITNELVSEISGYKSLFKELRTLNDVIESNLEVSSSIVQDVKMRLEGVGGLLPLEECHFKDIIYEKIVQKCTVAQEFETIKDNFTGFEIEEAGTNSITLF